MFGMAEETWIAMMRIQGLHCTPWRRKFIFLRKINGEWVFLRHVHMRHEILVDSKRKGHYIGEDYAINDLELIQKTDS